jgi:hypothetical protein
MSKSKRSQRWRISRIGGPRQQYVTTVLAPSENAAIKTTIKEHGIDDPEQQLRLVALDESKPQKSPHKMRL